LNYKKQINLFRHICWLKGAALNSISRQNNGSSDIFVGKEVAIKERNGEKINALLYKEKSGKSLDGSKYDNKEEKSGKRVSWPR